ncbi:replication initiation protein RepC [Epibacterium sp. SM1979]|uniref:Replication initiation protein RepC n=1 Tax=Tritonibacter litoralis TaxID=2662264 RepID=A0A843YE04_9RHOB|nr:plasmid replication protein RepC [Tritonibacter litoralis]MQQ09630.1 replication initiation protein RepC [Tritonibacter litoralis]
MEHLTSTPFGRRPVTAGLVARVTAKRQSASLTAAEALDKWTLFRDLTTARLSYDLGDRSLMVLNALLTFLPAKTLEPGAQLIVFPSNRSLADRCHGMAESTLRRHLAALVEAGVIARHDSPNGKRYARRGSGGDVTRAFGFDLSPLLYQAAEIQLRAETQRRAQAELKLQRERIALLRRDVVKLASFAVEENITGDWEMVHATLAELNRQMRRKLSAETLSEIEQKLVDILAYIQGEMTEVSEDLSGNDSQNERHYQSSKKDNLDSELSQTTTEAQKPQPVPAEKTIKLPLALVLEACPDVLPYCESPPRSWRDLVGAASTLSTMMGIDRTAWEEACQQMGPEAAAITLSCILQRFSAIRNPGGYLRSLTAKAQLGCFSPAPMVMALVNGANQRAA